MTFLLSLRGSVCLYQGEELALTEAELAEEDLRDPFGIAYWPAFRGRDGSRTPMPWAAAAPQAGFTTGEPWLPVPEAHRKLAVDKAEADPTALIHTVRSLLAQRRTHPALRLGTLTALTLPEPVIGFERAFGAEQIIALFNLSAEPVEVALPRVGTLSLDKFEARFVDAHAT
jgi:alpha-glucosidase